MLLVDCDLIANEKLIGAGINAGQLVTPGDPISKPRLKGTWEGDYQLFTIPDGLAKGMVVGATNGSDLKRARALGFAVALRAAVAAPDSVDFDALRQMLLHDHTRILAEHLRQMQPDPAPPAPPARPRRAQSAAVGRPSAAFSAGSSAPEPVRQPGPPNSVAAAAATRVHWQGPRTDIYGEGDGGAGEKARTPPTRTPAARAARPAPPRPEASLRSPERTPAPRPAPRTDATAERARWQAELSAEKERWQAEHAEEIDRLQAEIDGNTAALAQERINSAAREERLAAALKDGAEERERAAAANRRVESLLAAHQSQDQRVDSLSAAQQSQDAMQAQLRKELEDVRIRAAQEEARLRKELKERGASAAQEEARLRKLLQDTRARVWPRRRRRA